MMKNKINSEKDKDLEVTVGGCLSVDKENNIIICDYLY